MFEFDLYSLNNFKLLEEVFLKQNKGKDIVLMCVGTQKIIEDDFGPLVGDKLKELDIFVYGSSVREINGLNFMQVYNFIKKKHPKSKIIVVDSVLVENKQPILIYKNSPVRVSGINSEQFIGDESILFNSFSYYNLDIKHSAIFLIKKLFEKCIKY